MLTNIEEKTTHVITDNGFFTGLLLNTSKASKKELYELINFLIVVCNDSHNDTLILLDEKSITETDTETKSEVE